MVRFHVAPGSVVNLHENEISYLNSNTASSSTSSSTDSSPTQTVAKLNDLSINEKYLSQRPTTQQTAGLHLLNRAASEPGAVPSQTMQTSLSDPTLLSNDPSRPLIDGRPQLVYQTRAKSLPRPVHFTFSQEDIQASLYGNQDEEDELSDEDDEVYDEDATDSEVDDDEEQFVDARRTPHSPSPAQYKQRSRPRPIPVHFSWSRHDIMKSQSQPQTVQNVGHWKTFPKSSVMLFSAEQMKAVVNLKMYENKKMREAERRAELSASRKDEYEDEREIQRAHIQQQRQELIKKQKQLEQDFHRKHNEQALKLQQQKAAQQRQLQRSGSSSSIRTSSPAVNRAPSAYESYNQSNQNVHRLRSRQSYGGNGQLLSHGSAYKQYVNNASYHSPSSRSSSYSDDYNAHQQYQQSTQQHVDHWMNSIRKDVHSKVNKALPGYPVSKQQTYFPQLGGSSSHARTSSMNRVPQKPLPVQQQQHSTSLFTRR